MFLPIPFLWNAPTVSSPPKSLITYVHGTVFLTFFDHKHVFRPIWDIAFCKNIVICRYSNMVTIFKFRIFLIVFFIKVNISAKLYINKLLFGWSMVCIVVFISISACNYKCILVTISANLSIYIFLILKPYICKFCFLMF